MSFQEIGSIFSNPAVWGPIVVGGFLPLLVGYLTKESTSPGFKGFLFGALAAASGVLAAGITALEHGSSFNWAGALVAALGAWWTGQTAYTSLWKHKAAVYLQNTGPIKDLPDQTIDESLASVLTTLKTGGQGLVSKVVPSLGEEITAYEAEGKLGPNASEPPKTEAEGDAQQPPAAPAQ